MVPPPGGDDGRSTADKGIAGVVPFEKEQHGFRIAEHQALPDEPFLCRSGFHPADPIDPIVIDNLEE